MNNYYNHTTYPAFRSAGTSASLRAELDAIDAGFSKLATLSGNGGKFVYVNAAGTAQVASSFLNETSTGIGVGTASPAYLLDVRSTTGNPYIAVRASGSFDPYILLEASGTNAGWLSYSRSGQAVIFGNSGSERMRLTAAGRLGIGTTAPATALHVEGGADTSQLTVSSTATTGAAGTALLNSGGVGLLAQVYGPTYSSGSVFNVGASGTALFTNTSAQFAIGTLNNAAFVINTNGVQRAVFSAAGEVSFYSSVVVGTSTSTAGFLTVLGGGSGAVLSVTPNTVSGANGVVYNTSFVTGGNGPHIFQIGGSESMRLDASLNLVQTAPTTPPSLTRNQTLVMNMTSNTNLRISARGTDGVTRVANITLA